MLNTPTVILPKEKTLLKVGNNDFPINYRTICVANCNLKYIYTFILFTTWFHEAFEWFFSLFRVRCGFFWWFNLLPPAQPRRKAFFFFFLLCVYFSSLYLCQHSPLTTLKTQALFEVISIHITEWWNYSRTLITNKFHVYRYFFHW